MKIHLVCIIAPLAAVSICGAASAQKQGAAMPGAQSPYTSPYLQQQQQDDNPGSTSQDHPYAPGGIYDPYRDSRPSTKSGGQASGQDRNVKSNRLSIQAHPLGSKIFKSDALDSCNHLSSYSMVDNASSPGGDSWAPNNVKSKFGGGGASNGSLSGSGSSGLAGNLHGSGPGANSYGSGGGFKTGGSDSFASMGSRSGILSRSGCSPGVGTGLGLGKGHEQEKDPAASGSLNRRRSSASH